MLIGLVSRLADRVVPPVLDAQVAVWVVTVSLLFAAPGTKATVAVVLLVVVTTTPVGVGGRGSVNAALVTAAEVPAPLVDRTAQV